ncbi:hypothetical protein [Salininema proteolyticum]|uniref:Uncharacterized protein n=1 Tax=Salininema proteolyticum TaxID=1607685 RepID=A0ABV8TV76_9ACTN
MTYMRNLALVSVLSLAGLVGCTTQPDTETPNTTTSSNEFEEWAPSSNMCDFLGMGLFNDLLADHGYDISRDDDNSENERCNVKGERDLENEDRVPHMVAIPSIKKFESNVGASEYYEKPEMTLAKSYMDGYPDEDIIMVELGGQWDDGVILGRTSSYDSGPFFAIGRMGSVVVSYRFEYWSELESDACSKEESTDCSIAPEKLAKWLEEELFPSVESHIIDEF